MVVLVLASFLIPFLGAFLTLIIPVKWVKSTSQIISFLAFLCSLFILIEVGMLGKVGTTRDLVSVLDVVVFGITFDKLSSLVGLAVILVGFLIVVYSSGYLNPGNREHPEHEVKRRYYFFLLMFIGSMGGLVYSSTMIGLLIFFELTGVCSWALIGYYDDQKAHKSAMKAIMVTQVASLGLFIATAIFFTLSGTFQLSELAGLNDTAKIVIFIGIMIAAWGKSAQLPFHFWLPDAMVAPTPISAYLHAASMVKVGVFIFARCLFSAGDVPLVIGTIGVIMAMITMIYGFIMYFPQKDLKRLLAYSTITQLSYIFLGLSLSIFGSAMAFNGAVAHIFNHAFAKSLFFLVAGALSYSTGTKMLPSLKGIMSKLPLVGVSFLFAMLAVTGVPPFNGFFSKFNILAGGFLVSRSDPWLMVIMVIALLETVGSFAWLFWVAGSSISGEPSPEVTAATPLAPQIQFVLIVLAVLTLVSGYFAAVWMG
ncbi:MAG TPA: hydrogenase 4 subunit D [Anaerolineales bacterium]|nr:hydrogenase 4 subunit D [Anaerolineales bacterium]